MHQHADVFQSKQTLHPKLFICFVVAARVLLAAPKKERLETRKKIWGHYINLFAISHIQMAYIQIIWWQTHMRKIQNTGKIRFSLAEMMNGNEP